MTERLHGFWKLVSYKERKEGVCVDALGPDTKGFIAYTPAGDMSVLTTGGQRRLQGSWSRIPDGDKATNYDSLVAYAGRYEDRGQHVLYHVEICWIPNWVGRILIRAVRFITPDQLELKTVPNEQGVLPLDQVVLWQRQSQFVITRYTGRPVEEVFSGVIPHVVVHLLAIAMFTACPAIVTWLPSTM